MCLSFVIHTCHSYVNGVFSLLWPLLCQKLVFLLQYTLQYECCDWQCIRQPVWTDPSSSVLHSVCPAPFPWPFSQLRKSCEAEKVGEEKEQGGQNNRGASEEDEGERREA